MAFLALSGLVQASAQTRFEVVGPDDAKSVIFTDGNDTLRTPQEGLWSVATGWEDDWMTDWVHVQPSGVETSGGWTIVKGTASFPQGDLLLTDSYSLTKDGLVHCVRRFEWKGGETLPKVTLSVRLQKAGTGLSLMAPGIVYYGNKNGAAVNPELVAVWNGQPGEFAIFEDHRYPMPFVMLEDAAALANDGKLSSFTSTAALDKFGRAEMFDALKSDLKPLTDRLDSYANDGVMALQKSDVEACVRELNAIKAKFSAAAASGTTVAMPKNSCVEPWKVL